MDHRAEFMSTPTVHLNAREHIFRVSGALSIQLFLSIAMGIALFKVPQLQDMINQTDQQPGALLSFAVAIAYFSLVMWWSSRWILRRVDSPFHTPSERGTLGTRAGEWIPRLIPLCFLFLLAALAVQHRAYGVALLSALQSVLFMLFVWLRIPWVKRYRQHAILKLFGQPHFCHGVIALCFLVPSALAVFAIDVYVRYFEGLAIIFWGLSNMLLGCVLVTYYVLAPGLNVLLKGLSYGIYWAFKSTSLASPEHKTFLVMKPPYPVVTLIIATAFLVSLSGKTDNHAFRTLPGDCRYSAQDDISRCEDQRRFKPYASFADAFSDFKTAQPRIRKTVQGITYVPVYIVVNQGGGLRAAYWSAVTLSLIEQRYPGFHSNVFAMTGASGGTVGNTAYLAGLDYHAGFDAQAHDLSQCQQWPNLPACMQKSFLSQDFLSPVVTSFLHNDFLYRFVPYGVFQDDRAFHLERSFELAHQNTFGANASGCPLAENSAASESFLALGYYSYYHCIKGSSGIWRPLVLASSYLQELGAMSLTVPFNFDDLAFPGALDLQKLQAQMYIETDVKGPRSAPIRDIPLITAAVNSARFPYVTPAGSLRADMPWQYKIHTADAGYFDNFGAKTARQVLTQLSKSISSSNPDVVYVPQILVFKNDPFYPNELGLVNPQSPYAETVEDGVRAPLEIAKYRSAAMNEISAPLQSLLQARGGHSYVALAELDTAYRNQFQQVPTLRHFSQSINSDAAELLLFEFSKSPSSCQSSEDPPVGWWLSQDSRCLLDEQINHNVKLLADNYFFKTEKEN